MTYSPPPVGGGASPYVNYSGNPLRATAKAAALPHVPQHPTPAHGMRARDVKAVVHHTPAGDMVEYNATALPAIQRANAPAPHGGGAYKFEKR